MMMNNRQVMTYAAAVGLTFAIVATHGQVCNYMARNNSTIFKVCMTDGDCKKAPLGQGLEHPPCSYYTYGVGDAECDCAMNQWCLPAPSSGVLSTVTLMFGGRCFAAELWGVCVDTYTESKPDAIIYPVMDGDCGEWADGSAQSARVSFAKEQSKAAANTNVVFIATSAER